MSRREDIDNGIWSDADFDALTNDAQLLYLWSFTNPRCGMAGLYKVSRRQLLEGRLPGDALVKALAELEQGRFLYYRDDVLWVRSRVHHLRTRTEQMAKSIVKDVDLIHPDHPLREMFASEYAESWLQKALDTYALDRAILGRFTRASTGVPGLGQGKGRVMEGQRQGSGRGNGPNPVRHVGKGNQNPVVVGPCAQSGPNGLSLGDGGQALRAGAIPDKRDAA